MVWYDFSVNTWLLFQTVASPFSLFITFGCVWGLGLLAWRAPRRKPFHLWGGVAVLFFALIGARLDYVLWHGGYYLSNWAEIPQMWLGGLGPVGGAVGAIIGFVSVSLIGKSSFLKLTDAYLPLLGAVALSLGVASLFGGMGYGPLTDAWWGVVVQDEFGVLASRWPIHFLGGLISGGVLFTLVFLPTGWRWLSRPGQRGSVGLLVFALIQGAVSALRVDPGLFIWGLRWGTWAAMLFAAAGVVLLILELRYGHDEENTP